MSARARAEFRSRRPAAGGAAQRRQAAAGSGDRGSHRTIDHSATEPRFDQFRTIGENPRVKVLVIVAGGREHAFVWKIRQSPLVTPAGVLT